MVDVDSMMLEADPLLVTTLALALECEMLTNDAAREAYARIYGREWQPLSEIQAMTACQFEHTDAHAGTDARTCVAGSKRFK